MRANSPRPLPEVPFPARPTADAAPAVGKAATSPVAATTNAPLAPRVGTGPLRALGADEAPSDDLLDNAFAALGAGTGALPDRYPAVSRALAGHPDARRAFDELEAIGLLEAAENPARPALGALLETAAQGGKVSLLREIVKSLATPARLSGDGERVGHPGAALSGLAASEPQTFALGMFNLARNGYLNLPGGEKIFITIGQPATFGERLLSTGRLVSPQQGAVQALAATREVFYTPKSGWSVAAKKSDRRIERDAKDVNSLHGAALGAQVRRNGQAEARAIAKLSLANREAYAQVSGMVGGDHAGRLALQALLFEGRLPGKAKNADGATTLTVLADLTRAPMHPEIIREQVLSEALNEIHRPDAINQQDRGSCTMASVQIKLAKENPAEFLRLVAGLASPAGAVKLANGEGIVREPGTEIDDGSGRTVPARLFQAAMMEFANGALDYDNSMKNEAYAAKYREVKGLAPDAEIEPQDLHSDGSGGLGDPEVAAAVKALAGGVATFVSEYDLPDAASGKKAVMDHMRHGLAKGLSVPVGMDWGERDDDGKVHGGHEVLVTRIADGRVYYHNPWGQQESMPLKRFEARVGGSVVADFAKLGGA